MEEESGHFKESVNNTTVVSLVEEKTKHTHKNPNKQKPAKNKETRHTATQSIVFSGGEAKSWPTGNNLKTTSRRNP